MDWLADVLFGWFFDVLYLLQAGICTVADFIVNTFYKLSGLEPVSVDGKQTDLLSHFVQTDAVKTAFLGVFLVGIILLCVFVIIAIIRSEYTEGQQKRTKGQILIKAGHSFIIFLLIPFLLAAGILLTNAVMNAINGSMLMTASGGGGRTLFGGQILVTSGNDAYIGNANMRAEIERGFVTGALDYGNLDVVKQYYDLWHVNFTVGILSGAVLLVLFALAALRFVQRLFDIILLYVISPVSVATIPVDDGARFKLWREMLISKVLSAYGIILAMNLFFMIIPQVNRIRFYDDDFSNGLIGLLFVIGGAFAVTKAYMVIAQLTGSNAGAQEAQQTMAGIHTGARMARGLWRGGTAIVGQAIGGSDFRNNQKRGMGFGDNVNATIHSTRNQHIVNNGNGGNGGSDKPDTDKDGKDGNVTPPPPDCRDNTQAPATDGKENAAATTPTEKDSAQAQARTPGQTAAHIAGGAGRLATLPVGVLKDMLQGGLITTGKNIWPRLKNVATGRGVINRADVVRKGAEYAADKAEQNGAAKPEQAPSVNKRGKK
jgi:hypothetical protein